MYYFFDLFKVNLAKFYSLIILINFNLLIEFYGLKIIYIINFIARRTYVAYFFRTDLDKDRVKFKLYLPRLEMTTHYNINGKILLLPIKGNGLAHGNFTDIDVVATIQGERYQSKKTGEIHYRVIDFYVDFNVGHANIYLDNLFNGDVTLSNAMNLFLNDNWKILAAEIKPALENTVSDMFKTFSNKIYSMFPMDTLLPP